MGRSGNLDGQLYLAGPGGSTGSYSGEARCRSTCRGNAWWQLALNDYVAATWKRTWEVSMVGENRDR